MQEQEEDAEEVIGELSRWVRIMCTGVPMKLVQIGFRSGSDQVRIGFGSGFKSGSDRVRIRFGSGSNQVQIGFRSGRDLADVTFRRLNPECAQVAIQSNSGSRHIPTACNSCSEWHVRVRFGSS